MARTIQQAFLELKSNLEITDLQTSTVSTRQKNVRSVLEAELSIVDSFLTGSYARNSMIAPLSEADIDVFVVLDVKYYYHYNGQNGGPAGLLDFMKRVLRKTYTKTPDISRNGQAVTIRFEDFVVDVVPGFNRQGGGYLIPNSITQSWLSTDPKKHVEIFSSANRTHAGNLLPVIKMVKGWNRNIHRHFNSFHLEVLTLHILNGVTISDFPSGVRYVFDKARDMVTKQNPDPAGYGGDVGYYINTQEKVREAVEKLQLAYERAIKAEDFARQGYVEEAINRWRQVFGDCFPAYG